MKRSRLYFHFPVLLVCLSPFYQPALQVVAQCCGGGGGAAGPMAAGPMEPESACTAGNPKVTVKNTGSTAIKLQFGNTDIDVPFGQQKTVQIPPTQKFAPGQGIGIKLKNSSGGTPSSSDKAEVHWTFPQRDKKGDGCKKEEKNGTGIGETCGTDTVLQGGGSGNQSEITAKCGGGENTNQNPEETPKDPQGTKVPCANPGTLYSSGATTRTSGMDVSVPSYIGETARDGWSAGVIIPQGSPAALASYTDPNALQGASVSAGTRTVYGYPSKTAWSTAPSNSKGAVTAEAVGSGVKLSFYHPLAYDDDGSGIDVTGNPHRTTTITSLAAAASPAPATYTAGGIQTTVQTYDETTATLTGTRSVTVWTNSGTDVAIPSGTSTAAREIMTVVEEGGITIAKHATTTTMSVTGGGVATRTVNHRDWTLFDSGIASGTTTYDSYRTEVYQLFTWGEELVQETIYPDGNVSGYPAIVRDYVWWDSTMSQPSLEGSLKMTTEKHGTVGGGTWNTGSWAVTWAESSGSNTTQVSLKPWKNGSTIPAAAATLSTLQGYVSGTSDYAVSKSTSTPDGIWISSEERLGGYVVASSVDTGGSRELSEVTTDANASSSFVTRTARVAYGYFYLQPAVRYELRDGEVGTNYTDSTKLIAKTSWHREQLYPDATTPSDVLLASTAVPTGWTDDAPWEVEWHTRREFPETTPGGTGAATDYLIKECELTDSRSRNRLVSKRFLSTTDASSSDIFADTISTVNHLLETQIWTYDGVDRPLTRTLNGTVVEEWSYSSTTTTRTTVHTDEQGLQTSTTYDLLGRPVSSSLFANGTAGQNDVVTTWSYTARVGGKSGLITSMTESGGGAWVRTSMEITDALGRTVSSTDVAGIETLFTYSVAASTGEKTEKIILNATSPVEQEISVYYRDGQKKSRTGEAVTPESYNYLCSTYLLYTYRYLSDTVGTNYIGYTRVDGMGRIALLYRPSSGSGASTTLFGEIYYYDALGRVNARKIPTPSGVLYEVSKWERIPDPVDPSSPGSYARLDALSTDTVYDNADTSRRRTVASYLQAAPYGGATTIWWAQTGKFSGTASGTWEATAAGTRRAPLQETAMTINGSTSYIPLEEINEGGLRTITAENRDRTNRTITQRSWKHSTAVYRSITWKNGLPVTYTAPEQTGGVTRDYSPLREPYAEASFETYPYWPRVDLDPATGRVTTSRLPRRAAGTEIDTATYTYYPATSADAGRLATSTDSTTGGVTSYVYNGRGQTTGLSGTGTYPQEYVYDTLGRLTQSSTWRTAGVSSTKATTDFAYAGLTGLVRTKTYPDAGIGNRVVYYFYNSAGGLSQRLSQRSVSATYTYDGYNRLQWVNYSDSTPDVQYAYNADSGRVSAVSEGSLSGSTFTSSRSTAYSYRFDGMVTGETVTDTAGATVTLARGYDTTGKQNTLNQSWSQSPVGTLTSPALSYSYTSHQRFSGVTSTEAGRYLYAGVTRTGTTQSNSVYPDDYSFTFSMSSTLDTYGRVTSQTHSGGGSYSSALRWERDRMVARGKSSTSDRWEYRYNAKGEVSQAWKQLGSTVTAPTSGEVKSGTGSTYSFDDIGNRSGHGEIGRATVGTGSTSTLSPTDTRTTNYTANILNQYTTVSNPQYFDVRGTRSGTSTIVVNGDTVDTPTPTADSGYQPGGTGTYFRDEVPNTAPGGTSSPDLYEAVKVTQNGSAFTVDDPIQYLPPASESLTYDLDGNLLSDGRWTYTWDAADRLIRMESVAWTQPATGTAIPAATVPARLLEFGYDAFSRRIRKKAYTKAYGAGTWVLATWEASAYEGWNLIATYRLTTASAPAAYAGTAGGIVQTSGNNANYVWGPDVGSRLEARGDWQRAGGVGGLLMATYPSGGYYAWNVKVPSMDHMGNVIGVDYAQTYTGGGGFYSGAAYAYDYDAFGREVRSTTFIGGSADDFPFHFSTKFTDTETGLNYYGYRYYDPAKGRWLSRDPIGERGGINIYEIVNNRLINSIDRLGREVSSTNPVLVPEGVTVVAEMVGHAAPPAFSKGGALAAVLVASAVDLVSDAMAWALAKELDEWHPKPGELKEFSDSFKELPNPTYEGTGKEDLSRQIRCRQIHARYEVQKKYVQARYDSDEKEKALTKILNDLKKDCNKDLFCKRLSEFLKDLKKIKTGRKDYAENECDDWNWRNDTTTVKDRKKNHATALGDVQNRINDAAEAQKTYCSDSKYKS